MAIRTHATTTSGMSFHHFPPRFHYLNYKTEIVIVKYLKKMGPLNLGLLIH